MTFARACGHATNYACGWESRAGKLRRRLCFPDRHIEVDNRLSWFLGELDEEHGDAAYYVHLKRHRSAVISSFQDRYGPATIMRAFSRGLLQRQAPWPRRYRRSLAAYYVDTVTSNIDLFLRGRPHQLTIHLETARAEHQFPEFWRQIGATGDLSRALAEFDVKHNARSNEG